MSTTPVQAPMAGANLRHVNLVSGQPIQVQGDDEVTWFETTRDRYLDETRFTEATDLRDLDRLLVLELMVYRWTRHVSAGVDYEGHIVDEKVLQGSIKTYSDQITKVKVAMGMNKAARDAEANQGTISSYIADLKARAKVFGVHRENQLRKALVLMNELESIVQAFDQADEEERTKIGFESEGEIMDWVRTVMLPEFKAIDEYFRAHEQRYWVREG